MDAANAPAIAMDDEFDLLLNELEAQAEATALPAAAEDAPASLGQHEEFGFGEPVTAQEGAALGAEEEHFDGFARLSSLGEAGSTGASFFTPFGEADEARDAVGELEFEGFGNDVGADPVLASTWYTQYRVRRSVSPLLARGRARHTRPRCTLTRWRF